jgi:hypothetical protein
MLDSIWRSARGARRETLSLPARSARRRHYTVHDCLLFSLIDSVRAARWKWHCKALKRLNSAMEMAGLAKLRLTKHWGPRLRAPPNRVRRSRPPPRVLGGTVFGAQCFEKVESRTVLRWACLSLRQPRSLGRRRWRPKMRPVMKGTQSPRFSLGVPSGRAISERTCVTVRQRSWRDPAGGSPAQVRGSARLLASVAPLPATAGVKRTQQSCGVWD